MEQFCNSWYIISLFLIYYTTYVHCSSLVFPVDGNGKEGERMVNPRKHDI